MLDRAAPLLKVDGLTKHFPVKRDLLGRTRLAVRAVENISFQIARGEVLGLVGESGSGKSTVGRLLMRLLEPTAGRVTFEGEPLFTLPRAELKALRRRLQIVFQDPYSSLNRYYTVERTLLEPMEIHGIGVSTAARRETIVELLDKVGFGPDVLSRYPHEFSGGQRQRIGIARALVLGPDFIVADEPVSALDVSVQAQVLNIIAGLQRDFALTVLFITHDLSVVRQISDRVIVLYLGRIMEIAATEDLFAAPAHPYTRSLLAAAPSIDPDRMRPATVVKGEIPNPLDPPSGCPFRTRCPHAIDDCAAADMGLRALRPGRLTACIRTDI